MDRASGGSLSEPELRARIAAGSREGADYLKLATVLIGASRFEEAVGIYEQGLRLALPNTDKARLTWELGELLDRVMNRSTDAVALAREALGFLADEPESADTLFLRGLSYSLLARAVWSHDTHEGTYAARQATQWLERAISEHGESDDVAMAFTDAAWAYTALGDLDRAVDLCREFLDRETDPRHRLPVLTTLAEALRCAGRFPEAEDAAAQALQHSSLDPLKRPVLLLTLGLIRRGANQPSVALSAFQQALTELQMHPFQSWDQELLRAIYGNMAELHYERGHLAVAIEMFEQLLNQYPENDSDRHRILNWLGNCYAATGAHVQARHYYEQVLGSEIATDQDRADAREGLVALPMPPT